jgi:hypothetical protein
VAPSIQLFWLKFYTDLCFGGGGGGGHYTKESKRKIKDNSN